MNKTLEKILAGTLIPVVTAGVLYFIKPNMACAEEKEDKEQTDDKKKVISEGLIEVDYDTRKFTTVHLEGYANNLPGGINTFAFGDLESEHNLPKRKLHLSRYYAEFRISKPIGNHIELAYELDKASYPINKLSDGKEISRVGFNSPIIIKDAFFLLKAYIYNSDGSSYQYSIFWDIPIFKDKIKFTGFLDYDIFKGEPDKIVFEPQLLFKIPGIDGVWFSIQGRINDYQKEVPGGSKGVAFGARYKFTL